MALELIPTSTSSSAESLPIEAEGFTPDALRGLSVDEVRRFELRVGNTKVPAGDIFDVEGDTLDANWRFSGDLSGVHFLGAGMREGTIDVKGPIGRHAGARMHAGELRITGDAGDWLGAEMRGGRIEVAGAAGHLVGGAYRGSMRGMQGGQIIVRGSVGDEVGHNLRRGWIVIGGDCGQLAGYGIKAGTIFIFGKAGPRPGAEMTRGTIGLFGASPSDETSMALLPTFRRACRLTPQLIGIVNQQLKALGFTTPATVELWNGDLLQGGRGEVLLPG